MPPSQGRPPPAPAAGDRADPKTFRHSPTQPTVQIEELATKYFGSWSAGDRAQNPPAPDPALDASKPSFHRPQAFAQAAPSGPGVMQLYYRPGMASKDALAVGRHQVWPCAGQQRGLAYPLVQLKHHSPRLRFQYSVLGSRARGVGSWVPL